MEYQQTQEQTSIYHHLIERLAVAPYMYVFLLLFVYPFINFNLNIFVLKLILE